MVAGAQTDTLAPIRHELVRLGLGHPCRHPVLESPDSIKDVQVAVETICRIQPHGQPDLGTVVGQVKTCRHDANDLLAPTLNLDRLSNDGPSSKDGLPQLV